MAQRSARVGPYVLEGELGSGSMGAVWRARHAETGAHHALKVLRPELCRPADQARFRREIDLLARLNHPGLVRIHATDVDHGRLWYSMDLVEGVDLERMLVKGPLEHRLAVRIVRDVARAVQALHARGVVHRDLKPANVVIDSQGSPRLVDLGLARAFVDERRRLTLTGELVGTPYYMAPEQVRGQPATPAADVWGLGMLLYALLAGRPAWTGTTTMEVLEEVRGGRHVPLVRAVPNVSRKLAEVVGRALEPDPVHRWPSASELAEALDGWLRLTRTEREGRRIPLALGAAVLLIGSGSAGAVGVMVATGSPASVATLGSAAGGGSTAVRSARGELTALARLLQEGRALEPARFAALEALRRELASERAAAGRELDRAGELVQLEARLLIAEGELALAARDVAGARQRLEELERLSAPGAGRALRELQREGAAGLRGGLLLLDPRPGEDPLALLGDLTRLVEADPARADLRACLIGLALRCRPPRPKEAVEALTRAPDASRLAPDLRAEAWLAAGRLDRAEELMPALSPELRGRLIWRLALVALEEDRTTDALGLIEEGVAQAGADPGRAVALEAARTLLERSRRWDRQGDDPAALAAAIKREVEATRVVKLLDPAQRLDAARAHELKMALTTASTALRGRPETVAIAATLVEVADDQPQLYVLHAHLATDYDIPDPRRDLKIIRRGIAVAREKEPELAAPLVRYLAHALYLSRELSQLLELVRDVERAGAEPPVRACVLGRAGDVLRQHQRFDEAGPLLEQARQLDSDAPEHLLFQHWWERAMAERRPAEHGPRALELGWRWLEGWRRLAAEPQERIPELGKPGQLESWRPSLPDVCGWVVQQEVQAGRLDAALDALGIVLALRDDDPRWLARRLAVVARREPLPADELRQGLSDLVGALDRRGDGYAGLADQEPQESPRRALLLEAAGRYHALMDVKHLQEALTVGDVARTREGLENLARGVVRADDAADAALR